MPPFDRGVAAAVRGLVFLTLAGARACRTAHDCAFAGECVSGRCVCNAHWSGANCTVLNVQPAAVGAGGLHRINSSSWGGSVVWDPDARVWRMFFADMELHCGLDTWKRNSRIGIATSANATGPFTFDANATASIAERSWSHNPTVHGPLTDPVPNAHSTHQTTAKEGSSQVHLIYHIGQGRTSFFGLPRTDCTNGTTPRKRGTASSPVAAPAADGCPFCPMPVPPLTVPKRIQPSMLVSSQGIGGPWEEYRWGELGWSCNNPAAVFLRNGTVILACKIFPTMGTDGKPWRQFGIYVAPTWRGPYEFRRLAPIFGEDAYIWHDPKADGGTGAFKMLYHSMHNEHGPGKTCTTAWSKDGLEWTPNGNAGPPHPSPRQSYGLVIPLEGGGSLQTVRRERHQPIFGPGGGLIGLCNGVTTSRENDYSFTACVPVAQ